jgi:hypothetical protein
MRYYTGKFAGYLSEMINMVSGKRFLQMDDLDETLAGVLMI